MHLREEAVSEAAPSDSGFAGNPHSVRWFSSSRDHTTRYVWYVIFLLFTVNVFNFMDRMALATLAPLIKVELHLSDTQLGLLTGFAFSLFYAVCGIPIARWADRGNRRNIVAIALTIWSFMTALSGTAQQVWHLFAARVGVGAGEAGGYVPAQSMICDYVPPKRRAGVFAIHQFGLVVGTMVGMALAGWLGSAIGWRWAFVALGLPGIVLAVVLRLTLREPVRGTFDEKANTTGLSFRQTLGVLWACRTYRLLLVFLAANGFAAYGFTQWLPSLYTRVFGLGLSSVGVYLGLAIGIGSGVGLLVGGWFSNKLAQRDLRLPLKISAAAIALGLPAAFGSLWVSSAHTSMLLVSFYILCGSISSGPVIATLYSVTRPQMRATAGALSAFLTSVLGMGLGPLCIGALSDILTPSFGAEALRYALLAPVSVILVKVIALYAAAKALPDDLRVVTTLVDVADQSVSVRDDVK